MGYGPRPNECCALLAGRAQICLVGNHDLAALGRLDLESFGPDAADSARWTAAELSGEARSFLGALAPAAVRADVELYHASARDHVWEYVLTPEAALASLALVETPLALVGHSHIALAFSLAEGTLALAPAATRVALAGDRVLLNPGSVGQPRDGDPRAAWLLLDLGRRFAEFRRVPYPVEQTQAELRERGLPEALAARLEHGH